MQASDRLKAFHASANGERWSLGCDPETGRAFVLHEPGEDAERTACEIEVGSFLVLCRGPEQEALLALIGSLVGDPVAEADVGGRIEDARRSKWRPRWPAT